MHRVALHNILLGTVLLSLITWLVPNPHVYRERKKLILKAQNDPVRDTIIDDTINKINQDTIYDQPYKPSRFSSYTIKDRYGDPFSNRLSKSLIQMDNPSNVETSVVVDTGLNHFIVKEKFGDIDFRYPTSISYDDFNQLQEQEAAKKYWQDNAIGLNAESPVSGRGLIPRIPFRSFFIERVFGGDYIEFKPTGFVNLDFAYRKQKVANPAIDASRQRTGTFDFDPHASVNLVGQVGEKLKISTNLDTKASFDFENNFKVEYTGYEEEIIQKLEFGNVTFSTPSSLISGSQSLFGLRSELRFGKLRVNSVFSNQRATASQIKIEGGSQLNKFQIRASDYDENKHFFLGHFFRNLYEPSLATLPTINSGVNITRVEVYVTNRNNNTQTLRNFVGLTDLGEARPENLNQPANGQILPLNQADPAADNQANALYNNVKDNPNIRNAEQTANTLTANGFEKGGDYEVLRGARRLAATEYTFHSQLGYISLNNPLRNDEILAVAYEYTYNGRNYKVGELSETNVERAEGEVIILKLLRPSTIRIDLPTWDLMMKNVYALNASQIRRDNFQLRIIYRDDFTGLDNPSLQEGNAAVKDVPLITLLGLDQLNPRGDRQANGSGDGNFDFVEGITINSQQGYIIFPVLQPFGSYLASKFNAPAEIDLIDKYTFPTLYESTRNDAQQVASKNKFFITGQYEGSGSSNEYALPGINVAPGSVVVKAGGTPLIEGQDYVINYATGRITITNQSILASGKDITIDYESSDLFNLQVRTMLGTRLDYELDDGITLGGTFLKLKERPVLTRVNVGDEALNNTMLGADIQIQRDSRFLTKMVDALPLIQTKEKSSINFSAEVAQLIPRAAKKSGAVSYIDDFEGTETSFDLTRSAHLNWKLGATPVQFDRSAPDNLLPYAYNRALLAWYNIDAAFYRTGTVSRPGNISDEDMQNHYVRAIPPQEIFPNRQFTNIQTNEVTMDMAFFPSERGPFNYNPNLTLEGKLLNPEDNFGAVTRAITYEVDFDKANMEYIEFWMMDPFIQGERGRVLVNGNNGENNNTGGELYFNLGNISEDVMKDSRHFFENGLPVTGEGDADLTAWGKVPSQQYVNNAFENTADARANQDVGMDGLKNEEESAFFADYLNAIPPASRAFIEGDPSGDNFRYFLDGFYDDNNAKIVERYKYYNNTENNSPGSTGGAFTPSNTTVPDNEDLNKDNTLSDLDAYYEYKVDLRPGQLDIGRNYIVDKITRETDEGDQVTWYQFRVPVRNFDGKVGNIDGFKSIRFMRMYMTGWRQPVVLRLAQFQFVSNQWRRYTGDLTERGIQLPNEPYNPEFTISTVNIEENASSQDNAVPYILPPGVIRDQDISSVNNRELNEQAIQLCVEDLKDKDARAVFKNTSFDFINYKRLNLFIHADSKDPNTQSGEVSAFVRLGTDNEDNYYEIEVPLELTNVGDVQGVSFEQQQQLTWPEANAIDIALEELTNTKVERNRQGAQNVFIPYTRQVGRYKVTVVGNPDLSTVLSMMMGIRNPHIDVDDNLPKTVCVWFNEFRVTEFDETAGWAALANLKLKLADFANITASANYTTYGFGALNQRLAERERANTLNYDISGLFALDKFLPEKVGLKLPMFVSYERSNVSPRFNPLDPDVELNKSLEGFNNDEEREAYKKLVEDNTTKRSINFNGVRKVKTNPNAKKHFWDIENFVLSWSYNDEVRSNMNTAEYVRKIWTSSVGYNYNFQLKAWEPFKNIKLFNSPWLRLIKDFNIMFGPSSISIQADIRRDFTKTQFRRSDLSTAGVAPLYEKYFNFNRSYNLQWSFTKSLSMTYSASAQAVIDEPEGEIDTQENRDSIRTNLLALGRMKNFTQQVNFTYKLPLDKFPLTDWISADATYGASINWQANSIGLDSLLGNFLQNGRNRQLRGQLDLLKLYNKVKFLKDINTPPKPERGNKKDTTDKKVPNKIIQGFLRTLMTLRNLQFTYNIQEQTVLPGFLPSPKFFGLDETFEKPGWEFILGSQDAEIRKRAAQNGWLASSDSLIQNNPFTQNKSENIDIQTSLEPFKDFKIRVNAKMNRIAGYQEFYRADENGFFVTQNPVRSGSYSISFIALKTAFDKNGTGNISSAFETFRANREVIRDRLNRENPNGDFYNLNSQDVLIPAFLAAYTGKDVNGVGLSSFPKIPLPNWRIDYSGLNKIPALKSVFSSFNLSHSYTSEYRVGRYTSSLEYGTDVINIDTDERSFQELLPTQTTVIDGQVQFIPVFVIDQVFISERFSPLLGLDMRTKSNLSIRINYNKERSLTLNLTNAQVTEVKSQDITFGFGLTKNNIKLPFKGRDGKKIVLKNNVDFRLDFSLRDALTIQRKLIEDDVVTAGNWNLQVKPAINYSVDERLSIQAYFSKSINKPRITSSFPRTDDSFGIQLRYNLSQ